MLRALEQLAGLCLFQLYELSYNGSDCGKRQSTSETALEVGSQGSNEQESLNSAQVAAESSQTRTTYPAVQSASVVSSPKKKKSKIWLYGAIAAGVLVVIALLAVGAYFIIRYLAKREKKQGGRYELMIQ